MMMDRAEQTIYTISLVDAKDREVYAHLYDLTAFFQKRHDQAIEAVRQVPVEQILDMPLRKLERSFCTQFSEEPLQLLAGQETVTEYEVLRSSDPMAQRRYWPSRYVQVFTVTLPYTGVITPLLSWQHVTISQKTAKVTVDTKNETISFSVDYDKQQDSLGDVNAEISRQFGILSEIIALIAQKQAQSLLVSDIGAEFEFRKSRLLERRQVLSTIEEALPTLLKTHDEVVKPLAAFER